MARRTTTRIRPGGIEDTKGSDLVIVTASAPRPEVETSRRDFLQGNVPLVMNMMGAIAALSPSALFIIASSPADPLVYMIHRAFSIPREKVIGLSQNDTTRFRWAIARALSVPSTDVEAFVLGEHGETQVPIFSHVRIHGEPVSLKADAISRVKGEISGFFARFNELRPGRTAGWTTAESVGDIVCSMVSGDGQTWPFSVCLEGEYGLKEVSIGVPVKLALNGVKEIVEFNLDPLERQALEYSAASIRELIREGTALLEKGR